MDNDMTPTYFRDCKVCSVPHNDEIHEATLRIRGWLRHEVRRKLGEIPAPEALDLVPVEDEDTELVA